MLQFRVFDFSGVYRESEYSFPRGTVFHDMRGISGTSCYCDKEATRRIIDAAGYEGENIPLRKEGVTGVNFIDAGDYHYMTHLLMQRIREPFSLILMDNHPDMQTPAFGREILSCGGWVRNSLEDNPLLRDVLIVGIDPSLAEETSGFGTRVTVVTGDNDGLKDILSSWLLQHNETIYISIDKDVLSRNYASTDWSHGTMTMEDLTDAIRIIGWWKNGGGARRVTGIDICGELPAGKGGTNRDFAINAAANNDICKNLFLYLKD